MIARVFRLAAAVIMLQTLFFKFTAAPESVYIFSKLGMEPWGRLGIGVLELIASVLILIPGTTVFGAVLGLGLMSGALFFRRTFITFRAGVTSSDYFPLFKSIHFNVSWLSLYTFNQFF